MKLNNSRSDVDQEIFTVIGQFDPSEFEGRGVVISGRNAREVSDCLFFANDLGSKDVLSAISSTIPGFIFTEEELLTRYVYDPLDGIVGYEISPPAFYPLDSISTLLETTMGLGLHKKRFNITHLDHYEPNFESVLNSGRRVTFFCDNNGNTTAILLERSNVLILRRLVTSAPTAQEVATLKKRIIRMVKLLRAVPAKALKQPPKINIGMDIEFSIIDSDNNFHPATEFVADNEDGPVGTDGNVETLEMRPKYTKEPLALVDNLEELLSSINEIMPDGYDIMAGGGGKFKRSTGTHIHFSNMSLDNKSQGDIGPLIEWLDYLISRPIFKNLKGTERADDHYGNFGDYRNRKNHGQKFPHEGFEWRVLPTMTPSKLVLQGVVCLSYMIACAFEMGKSIEFDEANFSIKWYEGLPMFDKYQKYVEGFVDYVKDKNNLCVPTLAKWFKKKYQKDQECDVRVMFANDEHGYLAINEYVGYNPQKYYGRVVVWDAGISKSYLISETCQSLMRYFIGNRGEDIQVKEVSEHLKTKYSLKGEKTLFFGIPTRSLQNTHAASRGSRNMIKMFSQEIIKNI